MPVGSFVCAIRLLAGVALEVIHRVDGYCVAANVISVVHINHSSVGVVGGRSKGEAELVGICRYWVRREHQRHVFLGKNLCARQTQRER